MVTQQSRIADYKTDVANPLYREAEDRAIAGFLRFMEPGSRIEDMRHRNRHGDFYAISPRESRFLVDVKTDKWIGRTGRLAWEDHIKNKNGSLSPGWGRCLDLNFLAFVQPGVEEEKDYPWAMYVIHAGRWRDYIDTTLEYYGEAQAIKLFGWYPFDILNTNGKRGVGWAIPLHILRSEGLVWREELI